MQETSLGPCWAGSGLTVTLTKCDATRATLRLAGELDAADAPLLGACLQYHLDMGRQYVRADLSGLAFIDSSGLEAITEAHQAFLARRGTLILTGLNARNQRLIRLVGLDAVLLIAGEINELAAPVA
ncbi:MAG: STAS domain-containing protein [Actinomycetota bacterium]|nr:STAS domain-containing protein [Actinomycetota bacterium]